MQKSKIVDIPTHFLVIGYEYQDHLQMYHQTDHFRVYPSFVFRSHCSLDGRDLCKCPNLICYLPVHWLVVMIFIANELKDY